LLAISTRRETLIAGHWTLARLGTAPGVGLVARPPWRRVHFGRFSRRRTCPCPVRWPRVHLVIQRCGAAQPTGHGKVQGQGDCCTLGATAPLHSRSLHYVGSPLCIYRAKCETYVSVPVGMLPSLRVSERAFSRTWHRPCCSMQIRNYADQCLVLLTRDFGLLLSPFHPTLL
jgi:hypothetical protein